MPDQSGKTFVGTGANSGVGFAISSLLAARRARVLLACRDKAKADDAILRIRQNTPDAELAFLPLDLSDLKSVRTAAELAARNHTSTCSSTMPLWQVRNERLRRKVLNKRSVPIIWLLCVHLTIATQTHETEPFADRCHL
jgi:NAD(P)-dependent dehydrogenase (short-subunit alcohol dehydrogenase family)